MKLDILSEQQQRGLICHTMPTLFPAFAARIRATLFGARQNAKLTDVSITTMENRGTNDNNERVTSMSVSSLRNRKL